MNQRYSLRDLNRGPFKSEKDYYEAYVLAFLEHVKYLPLGHHCLFAPIHAKNEYDDYTGFRKALDYGVISLPWSLRLMVHITDLIILLLGTCFQK